MRTWKKAVMIGSFGAGALLLLKRRPAGIALGIVGLAALASEYPEEFEAVCKQAPEYLYRGTQIISGISRIAERFAGEVSEHGLGGAFRQAREEYGR